MTQIPTPLDPLSDALFDEPPMWPKVIGIISIAWGSLGLFCGLCGVVGIVAMNLVPQGGGSNPLGAMPDVMKPSIGQYVILSLSFPSTILLLAAGIVLVLRKPSSRSLHLLYALSSIPLSIAGVIFGLAQVADQVAWKQHNAADPWAKNIQPEFGYIAVAFSGILGVAWPLFLLIWFLAVKRRSSDISAGVREAL